MTRLSSIATMCNFPVRATLVALALASFTSVATAQAPSAPTGNARIVTDTATPGDKPCLAAGHRLEREQKSLERAQSEIARYDKLQKGCASKSVCARYASALESLDKRVARHQLRIGKFTQSRDKACKT
ncbi:MAG: hypothetical protein ABI881_03595 [Betaproteobacteria bacterium]